MQSTGSNIGCRIKCWIVAAFVGLLALIAVLSATDHGLFAALFLGALVFVFLGLILTWLFCAPLPEAKQREGSVGTTSAAPAPAPKPAPQPAAKPAPAPEPVAKPAPQPEPEPEAAAEEGAAAAEPEPADEPPAAEEAAPAEPAVAASTQLPGETELASRKGSWKYEAEPATDAGGTPDYDGDGKLEGEEEGSRPVALDSAREGGPDNLKAIKGVGPKLEQLLHSMGVYHFDQIAAWTDDEVAWMNANLKGFKGRVTRDNWVEQAKTLASGGETEFSKRVDKGDVY